MVVAAWFAKIARFLRGTWWRHGVNILRFLIQSYCYLHLFVCNAVAARFRLPNENVELKK